MHVQLRSAQARLEDLEKAEATASAAKAGALAFLIWGLYIGVI